MDVLEIMRKSTINTSVEHQSTEYAGISGLNQ